MAISDGDFNLIRNIRFEDVYVDDFQEGQLFNLWVVYNTKYNTGPGRGIENVYFKNIYYNGANLSASIINGLDSNHTVRNIIFENVVINGKKIKDKKSAAIKTGPLLRAVISNNNFFILPVICLPNKQFSL